MIDYDSFSRCHLTDIFFAIFAGAKELSLQLFSVLMQLNILYKLHITINSNLPFPNMLFDRI